MDKKSEIELSVENQKRITELRNTCILELNSILMDEFRKSNKGEDPNYFQYVAGHYSLYIAFATHLLQNIDDALKKFDASEESKT